MAMAHAINGQNGELFAPWFPSRMRCRLTGEISRAAALALALHLAGALALVCAIRYWPAVPSATLPARLELDLSAAPVPAPLQAEVPALEKALAEAPAEARALPMPVAMVPEARPAAVPEPAVLVTPVRAFQPSEAFQIAGEDLSALVVRPLPEHPPVTSSPVATVGPDTGHPVSLSGIQPRYPYAARVRGEAGAVTIQLRVTREGDVESASVSKSSGHPSLDESALSAARKARFKPAEKDGQPVDSEMALQFEFRLED